MKLIDERRINAVEIDLKDESGVVGFEAPVRLGRPGSSSTSCRRPSRVPETALASRAE
jgi:hypothetical protein